MHAPMQTKMQKKLIKIEMQPRMQRKLNALLNKTKTIKNYKSYH